MAALLCTLLLSTSALAQQPKKPRKPPPAEIVKVDLGWGASSLASDRWQPATIWITSQEKPFTGQLILSCQQDQTQNATMYVGPVSTTPGQLTPVEVAFSPSAAAKELTITLAGPGFRTGVKYVETPRGNEQPMPRVGLGEAGLVVFLGETSGSKAVSERSGINTAAAAQIAPPSPVYREDLAFEQMMLSIVPLVRMPAAWAAYESADLIVCDEDDIAKADPRARAALATWVRSGGRLVMRLDPVGSGWPELLAADKPCVIASSQKVLTFDDEFRALIPRLATTTVQGRALEITPTGQANGWKSLYPVTTPGGAPAGSLIAHGPCGLGMVALLGFEPSNVSALIDDESIKQVWRKAQSPMLPPHAKRGGYQQPNMWFTETGDQETIGAINSGLDKIASVPPIGSGVFWAICMCMLFLALLLGPIDAKLLKRKGLSQHSWLTAIGWIALAGLGAILVPRVMRSAESRATRLVFTDTLCDSKGQPIETAHYGLSGVFAGKPISFSLSGQREGSWLKGVSARQGYYNSDTFITLPDLHMGIQSQGDAEVPTRAAWGGEIEVPQWSFRTLSDSAPIAPASARDIGALVTTNNGQKHVVLTNLPAEAAVTEIWLGLSSGWYQVHTLGEVMENQRDRQYTVTTGVGLEQSGSWVRPANIPTTRDYRAPAGTAASLPWVRERADAVQARIAAGRWACVCVKLEGLPPNLAIEGVKDLQISQSTMLRLLTPLEAE